MPTILGTLGTDPADAALNRPALVLQADEVAAVVALVRRPAWPTLAELLADGRRTFGQGQLPTLRAELRATLADIAAAHLPASLVPALALQRLDAACATALELGLNLYVVVEQDGEGDE